MAENQWVLYLLKTKSGMLYTGITTNIHRRFAQHENGKGAKSLRGKGPLQLVFSSHAGNRSSASQLEYQVKQLSKQQKERLVICQPVCIAEYLALIRNSQSMGNK
ncbi:MULTISPECIES: GIY-YIG nuclease family protein [Photorhabdus]|uniref:GIY-YIG nuclease family protein n=1 Tax=Photorhabdus TaxID=29487 RepID=UPI000E599253|nr:MULTISPECIES: GIY-YIG nuclease family protein [Photorhabdus]MCA6220574.1 GIY-YIG nuclease family protein [Photorhabdus antumapuensis]